MSSFSQLLELWPRERISDFLSRTSNDDVNSSLHRAAEGSANEQDFLTLLSPAAAENLEALAQVAHALTLRNFGRAVNIFTPLYISDVCQNQCRYCGFNAKNSQKRRHLSPPEAEMEAAAIANAGFRHILLLTGDARHVSSPDYIAEVVRRIKQKFASIGIEIYSLAEEEYRQLIDAGVDSMTMFQETYNPELYDWLHPVGPKNNYAFRLDAPARAARAGMRSLGIGALLGLDRFEYDAFATGLHGCWLQRSFPGVELSVSIPRICPHEGTFTVNNGVTDAQLVQYVAAVRCFLPRAGITCSSRETAFMRDHLVPIGVTRVSAGVSTAVGGRATADLQNPGQFEISDCRSLSEMIQDLSSNGYQAVIKDWEAL